MFRNVNSIISLLITFLISLGAYASGTCEDQFKSDLDVYEKLEERQNGKFVNQLLMSLKNSAKNLPEKYRTSTFSIQNPENPVAGFGIKLRSDEAHITQGEEFEIKITRHGSRVKITVESGSLRAHQILTLEQYRNFITYSGPGNSAFDLIQAVVSDSLMLDWTIEGLSLTQLNQIRSQIDPFFVKSEEIPALEKAKEHQSGLYGYQYKYHEYAADIVSQKAGGFESKHLSTFDESTRTFLNTIKPGDEINWGESLHTMNRLVVLRRTDEAFLVYDQRHDIIRSLDFSRFQYRTIFIRRAGEDVVPNTRKKLLEFSQQQNKLQLEGNIDSSKAIARMENLIKSGFSWEPGKTENYQDFLDFYNSLRFGDEIVFVNHEKGDTPPFFSHFIYDNINYSVRAFLNPHRYSSGYGTSPEFTIMEMTPMVLFQMIQSGSLFVRKNPRPRAIPEVDKDLYPSMSVNFLEQERRFRDAGSEAGRSLDRMARAMRGMSEGGVIAMQNRIQGQMAAMAAIEMGHTNQVRRRRLDSIRAMRNMSDQEPFDPDLISHKGIHFDEVEGIEESLVGQTVEITIYGPEFSEERRKVQVKKSGTILEYHIPVGNLVEAHAIFNQLMESAYGALLESRNLWGPRNIADHFVENPAEKLQKTSMQGGEGYFYGKYDEESGTLVITKDLEKDNYYFNTDLISGLIWAHHIHLVSGQD